MAWPGQTLRRPKGFIRCPNSDEPDSELAFGASNKAGKRGGLAG